MWKDKIKMLLLFIISLGVLTVGWYFTEQLLTEKQNSILGQTGQMELASEKSGDQEFDENGELSYESKELSENQIRDILEIWSSRGEVVLHEPTSEELDMEQAIQIGEDWIERMAQSRILSEEFIGCDYDKVTAIMYAPASSDVDRSLSTYWELQFKKGGSVVSLTVHAASGTVWKANLSIKESEAIDYQYTNEELLEIAFPFIQWKHNMLINGSVKESSIMVDNQEPMKVLDLKIDIK